MLSQSPTDRDLLAHFLSALKQPKQSLPFWINPLFLSITCLDIFMQIFWKLMRFLFLSWHLSSQADILIYFWLKSMVNTSCSAVREMMRQVKHLTRSEDYWVFPI